MSFFLSLIMLILGNRNKYCLSFGLILLGISAALFAVYNDDKTKRAIEEIDKELDELDLEGGMDIDGDGEEDVIDNEEKAYVLQQLCLQQGKLMKTKRKIATIFYLCAVLLIMLGIIGIF